MSKLSPNSGDGNPRENADSPSEAAPGPKMPTPDYERGYRDGESNHHADWEFALMDILPEEIDIWPSKVAAYIRSLQQQSSPGRSS